MPADGVVQPYKPSHICDVPLEVCAVLKTLCHAAPTVNACPWSPSLLKVIVAVPLQAFTQAERV